MSAGRRVLLAFLLAAALLVLWAAGVSADCPLYRVPTQRFGGDLNYAFGNITSYDVASLNMSFYSDWSAAVTPLRPNGIEYLQLLAVKYGKWYFATSEANWSLLAQAVAANPGSVWMIGNEPECPNAPGGGVNTPEQYAEVYHDLYWYIKGRDSTARIAIGGVVEPTPLRLQWLGYMLDYYQATYGVAMPIDIWTTHVLILAEMRSCEGESVWGAGIPVGSQFAGLCRGATYLIEDNWNFSNLRSLVVDFRKWLYEKGYRNKPLWITEYGVLMPHAPDDKINLFMTQSFDYFLGPSSLHGVWGYPADGDRLVQRWAWNSINDEPYWVDKDDVAHGFNGSLFVHTNPVYPGTLKTFGQNYKAYTNKLVASYGCISGTVQFDGRPAAPHLSYVSPLTVTLAPVGCPDRDVRATTTDASGKFTVCSIYTGTYDIRVKSATTLAVITNSVYLKSGTRVVNLGLLRSGDCNNDNQVDIKDFSILSAAYATSPGDARYDARADLNGDGTIDVLDYSWLATRFGEHGAP